MRLNVTDPVKQVIQNNSFNPNLVRLNAQLAVIALRVMLSFNPNLVRLNGTKGKRGKRSLKSFNPNLVRLNVILKS